LSVILSEFRIGYDHDLFSPLHASWDAGAVAVMASNGGGKSTLLRTILGLVPSRGGSAQVFGLDPQRESLAVKKVAGWMPDGLPVPPSALPREILALARWARAAQAPCDAVERLGLAGWMDRPIGQCSLGQQRRTMLAAALLGAPRLLLLDEPTVGLDAEGCALARDLIQERNHTGLLTLIATHDLSWVNSMGATIWRPGDNKIWNRIGDGPGSA
jgi:ABC-2 type transport system ATP-binding protein